MSEENKADEPKDTATPSIDEQGYKDTIQGLQAELRATKERYKGVDPDEFFATRSALKELQREKAQIDPAAAEEYKETLRSEYAETIDTLTNDLTSTRAQLKDKTVITEARRLAATEFTADGQEILERIAKDELDFQDGKVVVRDAKGEPRLSPSDPRNAMTVEEWIEEKKEKYPSLVSARTKAGGRLPGESRLPGEKKDSDLDKARALLRDPATISALQRSR